MSREIKFRAWDDAIIHIMPQMVGPFMIKDSVLASYANVNAPLMQYTGLKDKNGVEIYEGDIVRSSYKSDDRTTWVILYDEEIIGFVGSPTITLERNGWLQQMDPEVENRESIRESGGKYLLWTVIGNIYENPELLESQS